MNFCFCKDSLLTKEKVLQMLNSEITTYHCIKSHYFIVLPWIALKLGCMKNTENSFKIWPHMHGKIIPKQNQTISTAYIQLHAFLLCVYIDRSVLKA